MKGKLLLLAASVLLLASSCDDGVIDLDRFRTAGDLIQLVDVPGEITVLVGEDYPLVVRLSRLPYRHSVTGLPADYGVIDCIDSNDSTLIVRGLSEGETTLTVQYSALTRDIRVKVRDMDLQGFTLTPETVRVACGETSRIWLDVTPKDYPVRNFRVDLGADDRKSVSASIQYDSVAMRGFVEVSAFSVGDFKVPVVGRERGKDKITKEIAVSCGAVPVTQLYFRTPVDTVVTGEGTSYVFDRLPSSCTVEDELPIETHWEPENATISGISYLITYAGYDASERKSYEYRWSDEDVESGEAPFLSPEEIRDLYARGVITSGEDLQRYIAEHCSGAREPAACELASGIVRDFSGLGFYGWNASALRSGKAELTVRVEYISGYSGLTMEKKETVAKLSLVFAPEE